MENTSDGQAYMKAPEVLTYLGIRHQTLYAYVSRGAIRSFRQPGTKSNLYLREDVERTRERAEARSGRGAIAASAMQYGEPIVPTSITEISAEGPRYRGRAAVELARQNTPFESVAELLWTGLLPDDDVHWEAGTLPPAVSRLCASLGKTVTPEQFMEVFGLVTLTLGISRGDVNRRRRSGNTLEAARQMLQVLVGCMGFVSRERKFVAIRRGDSVVQGVLRSLGGEVNAENMRAVEAILILLADHELAPGSFSARVAASSGASLHGCLVAAMCTHAGLRVSRVYNRAEEFLGSGRTRAALLKQLGELRHLGREIPGFTHRLYPKGDPRAVYLLGLAAARSQRSVRLREFLAFVAAAQQEFGLHPTVELAAVALCNEMGLPRESGGAMFAVARSAGWVAHVMEQRLSSVMLRPRAKFVTT
ncbi:MAG: citrate/2-methylcitrate synthase [Pseudomonadota bacterium]